MRKRQSSWLRQLYSVFAILATVVFAPQARAQEYQLKAAFLYNFAKQVEWPAEAYSGADAPLTVCFMAGDPIASSVQSLDGKAVNTRKISVKSLSNGDEAKRCQIMFYCESHASEFAKAKATLTSAPVLTVGEAAEFAQSGGIAALVKSNNKLQLKLNLKAAQQAGLKLSAQIIKLAGGE